MTRGGDPGTTVITAEHSHRRWVIFETLVLGVVLGFGPDLRSPNLVRHVPVPGVAAYLAAVTAASIWGCSRAWRLRLRMDDTGITVSNYFRTCRMAWHEVSSFADGYGGHDAGGEYWALSIVMHNGRPVTASATRRASASRVAPDMEMLTTIGQVAERYGIPSDLTGYANSSQRSHWPALAFMAVVLLCTLVFGLGGLERRLPWTRH